jgi:hypothetical protein
MFNWFKKKDNREKIVLNVVDFSVSPGARYIADGDFSGELFRKNYLYPKLAEAMCNDKILVVCLDGGYGYGVAFLEEAFGGLVRVEGESAVEIKNHLEIISDEEPNLINEVMNYLDEAKLI